MVVEDRGLDVCGRQAALLPQLSAHQAHLRQPELLAVVRVHGELIGPCGLSSRFDGHRAVLEVFGPLRCGDHDGDTTVGLLAAVEQPQRFGDPSRVLVVLDGDRLTVEVRLRVVRGVLAVGDRHGTEICAGGAVFVHVALRDHRHRRRRGAQTMRVGPAVLDAARIGVDGQTRHHLSEPVFRALVEGPIGDHHFSDSGGHGQRGLLDGRCRRTTAVADLAEERQITDSGGPRHGGLQVGVHGEGDQAVDVRRREPGVVERVEHRLGRQAKLAAAGVLGEVGRTDTGDRGLAGEHQRSSSSCDERSREEPTSSVAVAMTWLPRLLAPTTFTVATPSSTAVTSPVNVMVS